MAQQEVIEHEGRVVAVGSETLQVEIVAKSACSGCSAKHLCSASELKSKLIDVRLEKGVDYKVGDMVVVEGTAKMGNVAVLFAYVLPFLLMMAAVVVCVEMGLSDGVAGLAGIGAIAVYYVVLSFFKGRFEKKIYFEVRR